MRALVIALACAACTPDIVSGAYLCGQNATCPEGQACNGPDNTCVLASTVEPFACEPEFPSEPDNTSAQAHSLGDLGCVSVPVVIDSCMPLDDGADWIRFGTSSECARLGARVRITFPLAFQRLAVTLWDLDNNVSVAADVACTTPGEAGNENRCLDATLVPGTAYGIEVKPAGDGTCDGACLYNRYSLSVQLSTPG